MSDNPQKMFNVRTQIVQGKNLLIQRNVVYELDEVALRIWELCDGSNSVEEIAKSLYSEYDVEYHQLLIDCQECVEDLKSKNLLH